MPSNADKAWVDDLFKNSTYMSKLDRAMKKEEYETELLKFESGQPSIEDLLEIIKKEENKL